MADSPAAEAAAGSKLDDLYTRPGFLIRRANQIAVWLFLQEVAPLPITTTQYGAMVVLRSVGELDQAGLAKMLSMDKSTTALVVGKLEAAGYVVRDVDALDKRRKILRLTEAGALALDNLAAAAERARQRLLTVFTERQARQFIRLLKQYVAGHGGDPDTPPASAGRAKRGKRVF